MDLAPVGELVARLFEKLDEEYGELDVTLRAALVVVDIRVNDREGNPWTAMRWQFGHLPDFDNDTASSAYGAGIAASLEGAFTEGDDYGPELPDE